MTQISSLMCDEVLDVDLLNQTPEHKPCLSNYGPWLEGPKAPITVSAIEDTTQIKDVRILQNLLRNEHRFFPAVPDYLARLQPGITAEMRKIVTDWMVAVCIEQQCQAEVFFLAVNVMDRFLGQIQIHKDQMQLLACVCIMIASKIREPLPIPGKYLIEYTLDSITAEELKVIIN